MLNVAIRAAREAGRLLLKGSRGRIEVDRVGHRDIKLAMDRMAERAIISTIRNAFPNHGVLSEECGRVGPESEYLWVIDPLDGTVNYFRRIPQWGTSVALLRGGERVLGVIFDPIHDELFCAEKGRGAFLNGRRIRVSTRAELQSCAIAYGYSANEQLLRPGLIAARRVTIHSSKVRALGSAVLHLAYVACGRLDGFFEYGLHHWDVAAGLAILREAGGTITQRTLRDGSIYLVCSNGLIHRELLNQVEGRGPRRLRRR